MDKEKLYNTLPPGHRDGSGMSMQLKTILRSLIKQHGISVAHLARTTKVPLQTIHGWLNGSEPKSLTQVKKIADYFDVSLDYLCFGIIHPASSAGHPVAFERDTIETIERYNDEINAGVFEVVLRRVKKR